MISLDMPKGFGGFSLELSLAKGRTFLVITSRDGVPEFADYAQVLVWEVYEPWESEDVELCSGTMVLIPRNQTSAWVKHSSRIRLQVGRTADEGLEVWGTLDLETDAPKIHWEPVDL